MPMAANINTTAVRSDAYVVAIGGKADMMQT